jgi:hypothetical protein
MKPDKIYLSLALLIILTTFSWISSCTHQTDITNMPEICFKDVYAIIRTNCSMIGSGCHDGNGESIDLTTYQGIHDAVVPFNADKSPLYKAITSVRGEVKMPPDQPLTEESRSTIRFWIEQGAVDSTANSSVCSSSKSSGRGGDNNFLNNK